MSREYPLHPIPGVGVIAFKENTVLLIQRGKEPRRGEWSIPGGAVEVGETVREAARREFAEECGGDIELRDLVEVVDIFGRDETGKIRYHYIVADYWAEWRGGELRASSDVMDARWVSPDQVEEYGLPSFTRAVIDKAFQMRNQSR